MRKRTIITQEIINKICKMYLDKISKTDISKTLDISIGTVSKYLKINNIDTNYIKKEQVLDIIEKYNNGMSISCISKIYNMKQGTISKCLKANSIEIRKNKFNAIQKEHICNMYKSGMSEEKIAKELNSNRTTIRNVLKERHIQRRNNAEYRQYKINENYFDEIDTPNKAYILGFLYADGNVSKNKYNIQLSLHEQDKEILEKIKLELESEAPLHYRNFEKYNKKYNINTHNQWALLLHCKRMHESLKKYGVVPLKTHDIVYPKFLSNNLHNHFLRGVMDGDGCIHAPSGKYDKLKAVDICGTKSFCEQAKVIIEEKVDIHCSVIKTSPNAEKTTYRITVSGGIQVPKFLDWLYKEADLKLERKYNTYLNYYCKNKENA